MTASSPPEDRILPVHVTRPMAASLNERLSSRSVRIPFRVPTRVEKWRVVIRNANYRGNVALDGAVTIRSIAVGDAATNATGSRTGAFGDGSESFPEGFVAHRYDALVKNLGATEWTSEWFTHLLLPHREYLLAYGYRTNGQVIHRGIGGGWWTGGHPLNAELRSDPSATRTKRPPLDVRVEIVVPGATPTQLVIGDSIAAGSSADFPILEAPALIAATSAPAAPWPVLHTFGGASMPEWLGSWSSPQSLKWQDIVRYGKHRQALIALGSNDIHAGKNLRQLQRNLLALADLARERVAPRVTVCTVTPRRKWAAEDPAKESVRREFNNWLLSCPEGIAAVVDTATEVTTEAGTPIPAFTDSDGLHFNSRGSEHMAAAITTSAQHGRRTRLAPVALSTSVGQKVDAARQGSLRFPFNVNAPISRWRLHIRNHNDRFGISYATGAQFAGLWVGEHAGEGAFSNTPRQLQGPFTLSPEGQECVTPWFNHHIGDGRNVLLSLAWTSDPGPKTVAAAGCYRARTSVLGGAVGNEGFARSGFCTFSWWIEVETPVTTAVVAMWGDSLTSGTGNHLPIYDSPLSQYCREVGVIPVHYSYPGTGMISWIRPDSHQWTRWSHLTQPDAVIHFMGNNDVSGSGSVHGLQDRYRRTIDYLHRYLSPTVHLATLPPSATKPAETNTRRIEYNHWLSSVPTGALSCVDFSGTVSAEDGTALRPDYDCGDHRHLSTAGSTALAAALTHHDPLSVEALFQGRRTEASVREG